MKKLVLGLTLVAFAMVPALQAGEGKECAKNKAAAACTEKAQAKASCASECGAKKFTKRIDAGSKGATLLVKR